MRSHMETYICILTHVTYLSLKLDLLSYRVSPTTYPLVQMKQKQLLLYLTSTLFSRSLRQIYFYKTRVFTSDTFLVDANIA